MTNHGAGAEESAAFDKLMNEVMASAKRFGHREHIYLTWLAIREFGVAAAVALVSEGIQSTARYAGAPQSTTPPSAVPGSNSWGTTQPKAPMPQPCNVAEAPIGAVTLRAGCSAGDASIQRLAELDRAAPCRARYSWPWWGDEP